MLVSGFEELAASRKAWIEDVLKPWCRSATRRDLLQAEADWTNIAGKVDPNGTLWNWAWSRFPVLVHEELPGLNETHAVVVALTAGEQVAGFPDARLSTQGRLSLLPVEPTDAPLLGPYSIDEIASVVSHTPTAST